MAALAASRADSLRLSMISVAASTTTMASSTTRPMANTSANRVSVLSEKPSARKALKVPIRETGIASIGIRVARQLSRKMNTTSNTSTPASSRVLTTSCTDSDTNRVVS